MLNFNWIDEQGSIQVGDSDMEVRKHGMLSGHWTLERSGESLASAHKSSPLTRTFDVEDSSGRYRLQAVSAFGRSFHIQCADKQVAIINPVHAFTRRANIEVNSGDLDFATTCFSFWLVVLMWRRASKNSQ